MKNDQGRDFDIWNGPLSGKSKEKKVERGRHLTFTSCPGVEGLSLGSLKMSNSPRSACTPTLGETIVRCINESSLALGGFLVIPRPSLLSRGANSKGTKHFQLFHKA